MTDSTLQSSHDAAFTRELSYAGGDITTDIQDVVSGFLQNLRHNYASSTSSEQPMPPSQKQDDDALTNHASLSAPFRPSEVELTPEGQLEIIRKPVTATSGANATLCGAGWTKQQPPYEPEPREDNSQHPTNHQTQLIESLGREMSERQSGTYGSGQLYIPEPCSGVKRTQDWTQEQQCEPQPREENNPNQLLSLHEALVLSKVMVMPQRTSSPTATTVDAGTATTAYASVVLAVRREIQEHLRSEAHQ